MPKWFVAVFVAAFGVLPFIVALVVLLLIAVASGARLFKRATELDHSFAEILHKQEQQRVLLTTGRGRPQSR